MPDCMTFPNDPLAFVDEYSFEDEDHVYTNGSKLIPAFRVKQGIAHYFAYPSGWISVKDRLPSNADHPGAFCPKYQVLTKYGITEGWYNPNRGRWYVLVWFFLGRRTFDDIDFERGDIPGVTDKIEVTHWKEMSEPPEEDANGESKI